MNKRYVVNVTMTVDLVVVAENHIEAIKKAPLNASPNSVREESKGVDHRLTVVDWCTFCAKPLLSDIDGSFNGVPVPEEMLPVRDRAPFGLPDTSCRECAIQKGLISP